MVIKIVNVKKNSKDNKYKCPDCGKSFSSLNNLALHFQAIHQQKENKDIVKSSVNSFEDAEDTEHSVKVERRTTTKSSVGSDTRASNKLVGKSISSKNRLSRSVGKELKSEQKQSFILDQDLKSSIEVVELPQTPSKRKQDSYDIAVVKRLKKTKNSRDDNNVKSKSKFTADDLDNIYNIPNECSTDVSVIERVLTVNEVNKHTEDNLDKSDQPLHLSEKLVVKSVQKFKSNKPTVKISLKDLENEDISVNVSTNKDNSDNVTAQEGNSEKVSVPEDSSEECIINPNTGQFEKKPVELKEDNKLIEENKDKENGDTSENVTTHKDNSKNVTTQDNLDNVTTQDNLDNVTTQENSDNVATQEGNLEKVTVPENSSEECIINPNTGQFEKKPAELKEDNKKMLEESKNKDPVGVGVQPFQMQIFSPEECIINPLTGQFEMKPMDVSEFIASMTELPDFSNLNKIVKESTTGVNLVEKKCLEFSKEGPQRRNEMDSDSEDEDIFKTPVINPAKSSDSFSELRLSLENVRKNLKKSVKFESKPLDPEIDLSNNRNVVKDINDFTLETVPETLNNDKIYELVNNNENFQSDEQNSFSKDLNVECEIYQFNHWRHIEEFNDDNNFKSNNENVTEAFNKEVIDYTKESTEIFLQNPGVCMCTLEIKENRAMRKAKVCTCNDNHRKIAKFGQRNQSEDVDVWNRMFTYSLSLRVIGFSNKNYIIARSTAREILSQIIENVFIPKINVEMSLEKDLLTCDKCEATFSQSENLLSHKKFFHRKGTITNDQNVDIFEPNNFTDVNIENTQNNRLENEVSTLFHNYCAPKAEADKEMVPNKSDITCGECGKSFISGNLLINHKKDTHYSGQFFECGVCSTMIANKVDLKNHIKETHSSKIEGKALYGPGHNIALQFTKELSLNSDNGNVKLVWKSDTINMEQLELAFTEENVNSVTEPTQKMSKYTLSKLIDFCKQELENMGSILVNDMNTITPFKGISIDSKNKENLNNSDPMDTDVMIIECIFKCLECFVSFTNENEYTFHKLNIHITIKHEPTDENGILCEKCNVYFDFGNERNFDMHEQYFHGQLKVVQPAKKLKKRGTKLDKAASIENESRNGIMQADNSGKYIRNGDHEAPKVLNSSSNMLTDISNLNKINPKERKVISEKSINNESDTSQTIKEFVTETLKIKTKQNGNTMLPCDNCDKMFVSFSNLERHMRIHYSCDHCGYKCSNQENLQKHIRSIHSGARLPCDQCDYKAGGRNTLRRHKVIVHKNGPSPNIPGRPSSLTNIPNSTKEGNFQMKNSFQEIISISDDTVSNIKFSLPENTSRKRKQLSENTLETHLEKKKQRRPSGNKENDTTITNDGVEEIEIIEDYTDVRTNNKQQSNTKSRRRPPPGKNSHLDYPKSSESKSILRPCKDCGEKFEGNNSSGDIVSWFVEHSKRCSKQSIKNPNACDQCGMEFRFPVALEAHKKQYCLGLSQKDVWNNKNKQFTCYKCSKTFDFAIALYEHKDACNGVSKGLHQTQLPRNTRHLQEKVISLES